MSENNRDETTQIESLLDGQLSALPFVRAVVRQLTTSFGGAAAAPLVSCPRPVAERVIKFLEQALTPDGRPQHLARCFAEDPVMLSVFFQNFDLLCEHQHPGADIIGSAILDALEELRRREPSTGTA